MTKIILLMWLADIAGNIGVIGFLCLFGFVAGVVISVIAGWIDSEFDWKARLPKLWFLLVPVAIATITPDKSTIRLMVAAEAVTVAANTPLGLKSVEAINAVIDRITREARK